MLVSSRPARTSRRGATAVECAIVLPIAVFLMLFLIVGGIRVFRYQEVATPARERARYASTHGHQYRKDGELPVGTTEDWKKDIYDNGIAPKMVALDAAKLSYS